MKQLNELDLNLLVALQTLLRERSVTRAARRLGVTQPAMSHRLKRLRETFGDPLFVPSGRGLSPTPQAEQLEAPLTFALEAVEGVLRRGAFDPAISTRTFRVGTSDYAEARVLPMVVARLATEAPSVSIVTRPTGRDVEGRLASGDLHVAIQPAFGLSKAMRRVLLHREGYVVLGRADHPAFEGGLTRARYLAASHVVVAPRGDPGTIVDQALARTGQRRRIALRVGSFLSAPFVVARSDLLFTAPTGLADVTAPVLGLTVAPAPVKLPEVPIHLLWHPRFDRDPGHRWMRQLVPEVLRSASAPAG